MQLKLCTIQLKLSDMELMHRTMMRTPLAMGCTSCAKVSTADVNLTVLASVCCSDDTIS